MSTRTSKARKNSESAAAFPTGQWVDVEKVRVREDGKIDLIIQDKEMPASIANRKRTKAKNRKRPAKAKNRKTAKKKNARKRPAAKNAKKRKTAKKKARR